MSTEKTQWVELQVTMPASIRATIHECHRILGSKASGWAREILLERLPELVNRAERREREIQALFTHGKPTGSQRGAGRSKRKDAAHAKAGKTGGGRKAKA